MIIGRIQTILCDRAVLITLFMGESRDPLHTALATILYILNIYIKFEQIMYHNRKEL